MRGVYSPRLMPPKRKTPRPSRPSSGKKPRHTWWTLILVDQEALRSAASGQCGKCMESIEKARADLARFEREDRPAFERWMAAKFGQSLTELRTVEAQYAEKAALAEAIEMELIFGGSQSHHEAYLVVMKRRERVAQGFAPEPEEGPGAAGASAADEDDDEDGDDMDRFILGEKFEEYCAQILGRNPDQLNRREYDALFKEFKRKISGQDAGAEPRKASPPPRAASSAAGSPEARVKELYRLLVRRLHPDTRADGDATVAEVWHEVQAAYAKGDVGRLETLLAFADVREKRFGAHTSLGQMRAVISDLVRTLHALRRSLSEARKAPAWNFSGMPDRAGLERQTRAELTRDLFRRRAELADINRVLENWTRTPIRRRSAKRGTPGRGDEEFSF